MPAELTEDTSKDGATKFEDIEGGGIGDGEGVKDVSEQIESEEQVSTIHLKISCLHVSCQAAVAEGHCFCSRQVAALVSVDRLCEELSF